MLRACSVVPSLNNKQAYKDPDNRRVIRRDVGGSRRPDGNAEVDEEDEVMRWRDKKSTSKTDEEGES